MFVGGTNVAAISNAVWTASTRNLTTTGSVRSIVSSIHTTLANGAGADLRPGAGNFREVTIIGEALANVTWVQTLFDGTTVRSGPVAASGAAVFFSSSGTQTFGPSLNNNGTVSGSYNVAGTDWT